MSTTTRFGLWLSLDNDDAHQGGPDALAGYLRDVASRVQAGYGNGNVRDLNGNTIGAYAITDDEQGTDAPHEVVFGGDTRGKCERCGRFADDYIHQVVPGHIVTARDRAPAHCRHHIEFRSDCDQCVTERTYQ